METVKDEWLGQECRMSRQSTEDRYGSSTLGGCPALVQTHRVYSTKQEPSCKLCTLGFVSVEVRQL